jgi:5-hydroxyisourate hydrolase-like protein (transthyretin family)
MIAPAIVVLSVLLQTPSIHGIVLKAGNSAPLARATVELQTEADGAVLNSIATEDDGRFTFENVRPGRYKLNATRRGYVRRLMTVTVSAGQSAAEIRMSMNSTGAIYGRVYDANNRPLGNVEVQAMNATYAEGERVLTAVQSVVTNDLGEYRLFWLNPGRYYVTAVHPKAQSMFRRMFVQGLGNSSLTGANGVYFSTISEPDPALGGFEPEREEDSEQYLPIFFGGTADEDAASAVDVRAAAEVGPANIVIGPVRPHHVRGVVLDGMTRAPARYASLSMQSDEPIASMNTRQVDPERGTFDIVLPPGTHALDVSSANGLGHVIVKVENADIDNVTILTVPAFDISGRMTIEGAAANAALFGQLRITLRHDPPRKEASGSGYSVPLANGSFTLAASAGDFRVNIHPILNVVPPRVPAPVAASLQNAYVKSIRLGESDVLNGKLHLERETSMPLEIVVALNPGAVKGRIRRDSDDPAGDVSVVLVPEVRRRLDLYRTVAIDSVGGFVFDRVPPGNYKVFAWEDVEEGAWYDPDFMSSQDKFGLPLQVIEGRATDVVVPVIH